MDSTLVNNTISQGYIQELILNMPLWIQATILLVFIPIGFVVYKFIMNEKFREGAIKIFSAFKTGKLNLSKHEIFSYKIIATTYIDILDVGSKLKTDIFRTILSIKIKTCIRNIEYFLVRYERHLKDDSNISLRKEFSDLIERCVSEYEKDIFEVLKKKYKKDAVFLYEHIYKDSFERYHSTNIAYILKVVERFNNSKISPDQKVHMFLNLIQVALDIAIMDCERTFRDLNGSLKEYEEKYK